MRLIDADALYFAKRYAKADPDSDRMIPVRAVDKSVIDAAAVYVFPEYNKWIPVTERLPEPGERVLATDGGFVGELYVNSRGQWKRYNVNDHSLLMALDILWWMPMPQPPKEVPENETL